MKTQEITVQADGKIFIAVPGGVITITRKRGDRRKLLFTLPDHISVVKDETRVQKLRPVAMRVI